MGIFRRRSKDLLTSSGSFRMVVTRCFFIPGRGVVVTGRVEAGTVDTGDGVTLERAGQAIQTLVIDGIEHARRVTTRAAAGESVGFLFRDVAKGEIVQGDVIRT